MCVGGGSLSLIMRNREICYLHEYLARLLACACSDSCVCLCVCDTSVRKLHQSSHSPHSVFQSKAPPKRVFSERRRVDFSTWEKKVTSILLQIGQQGRKRDPVFLKRIQVFARKPTNAPPPKYTDIKKKIINQWASVER